MLRVNITLPVYNEEEQLASSVHTLNRFLEANPRFETEVVIADNGSTDGTLAVAHDLERGVANVKVLHLPQKGRGRALKAVWGQSAAEILSYMDVDLSTDLTAFPAMMDALVSGHFDLATGTRLHADSVTKRCWKREIISRCYNRLLKVVFGVHFSDAQCGFKAITTEAAKRLLPATEDTGWFFDTELLVLAEDSGYRVFDLPVRWTEDADSRVRILSTAWGDLKGIVRLRKNLRRGTYTRLRKLSADPRATA